MSSDMLVNLLIVGVSLGAVYAIMAMGLTVVYGITKVFNFAQGSFYTWGAYFAWLLIEKVNLPYGLAFVTTLVIMFGFGLAYERVIIYPLRRFADWGWTAIIVTLGSALFLDNLGLVIFGSRSKTLPPAIEGNLSVGGFLIKTHDIVTLIVLIVVVTTLILFLGKTKMGMSMQATAQDTVGAKIVGIPINRVFANAFAITAVLAAIAGVLLAPRTMIYPTIGWPVLTKAFVVVIFGGLGSIKGSIVAAFVLAMIEVFTAYYIGAIWGLPLFLGVLIVLLVVRPRGLFGTW